MPATRPLQDRADCKANFNLIRSWISQCDLHPICSRVPDFASKFQLPTRLVDIETAPDATPRLILSSEITDVDDCRYVALSHCWGDPDKVPKTTRATLTRHQERIMELSKTFEDAIEVTRQIGVRYLWIDSLCIIQGDKEDWEIECSKMSLIYARAYCVLSGLGAEDGSVGLFIPRTPDSVRNSPVWPLNWTSMLDGPLKTRGWAFQEHQLSTRIVHFTKSRLLWECRVCVGCEDYLNLVHRSVAETAMSPYESGIGNWRLFDGKPGRYSNRFQGKLEQPSGSILSQEDIHTRWLSAVEVYSSRGLTFPSDKLPALSGLAAAVSSIIGEDSYLAGIWESDLMRSLLWQRVETPVVCASPRQTSMPSWSWASYSGQVCFLVRIRWAHDESLVIKYDEAKIILGLLRAGHYGPYSAQSIECQTTLSTLDPFGNVRNGVLQIFAFAKEFKISLSDSNWNILHSKFDGAFSLDDPQNVDFANVTFATLLGTTDGRYGLVLVNSGGNTFRRVGIFYMKGYTKDFERKSLTIV